MLQWYNIVVKIWIEFQSIKFRLLLKCAIVFWDSGMMKSWWWKKSQRVFMYQTKGFFLEKIPSLTLSTGFYMWSWSLLLNYFMQNFILKQNKNNNVTETALPCGLGLPLFSTTLFNIYFWIRRGSKIVQWLNHVLRKHVAGKTLLCNNRFSWGFYLVNKRNTPTLTISLKKTWLSQRFYTKLFLNVTLFNNNWIWIFYAHVQYGY